MVALQLVAAPESRAAKPRDQTRYRLQSGGEFQLGAQAAGSRSPLKPVASQWRKTAPNHLQLLTAKFVAEIAFAVCGEPESFKVCRVMAALKSSGLFKFEPRFWKAHCGAQLSSMVVKALLMRNRFAGSVRRVSCEETAQV